MTYKDSSDFVRVKIGEFSREELFAPSGIVEQDNADSRELTNWQAMQLVLEGLGGQAIAMTMNGHGSPEANTTNSTISRQIGRTNDPKEVNRLRQGYVFAITGLLPTEHAAPYERM